MGVPILFFSQLNFMNYHRTTQFIKLMISILIACCLGKVLSIHAQIPEGSINIFQIDTSQFPEISFYLTAADPDGKPIQNLTAANIQIKEDSISDIKVTSLETEEPGIQMIIAYNLGPALSNSASTGGTRYQAVNDKIATWVEGRPSNSPDDFSLATNTGLQSIRTRDPKLFSEQLRSFNADLGTNQPNLTSLLQSLDLATDPNRNALMKRVILFVTPQINVTNVSAISGLIDRAVQQNVMIFVWLVGPANVETTNPTVVQPLKDIAVRTGGQFFIYTGEGELPNPEDYLSPMRKIYKVDYTSTLRQKGTHLISAIYEKGPVIITSKPSEISLSITPPNIIVIDPVFSFERVWVTDKVDINQSFLTPNSAIIKFMIEFPDGNRRKIIATRLYENGNMIVENLSPPFDQLEWDISTIESSKSVELILEVEDNIGLKGRSIPLNVQITVDEKPLSFWQALIRLQLSTKRWIILGSVLTTGIILVLAIVLAGKRRDFWKKQSAARERRTDPLTQPVSVRQEISRMDSALPGTYPSVKGQVVTAWLVPLNDRFETLRAKAIPLTRQELVIGKDSQQSGLVIPSPAMSDVHARLTRDNKGDFWLADNNSIAGTWVNYAPLSTQGSRLRHGDLVHFANNAYRFELTSPPLDREPQLITYNNDI